MSMKDSILVALVVLSVGALIVFMPYIAYFVFHVWDGASNWNCRYHGGYPMATSSAFGGPIDVCELPITKE